MLQACEMGRPKKYNYPPNMTLDTTWGKFVVRNPITKLSKRFTDEQEALQAVKALNEWLECERQARALLAGRPTIKDLVGRWKHDRLQFMPWDKGTANNALSRMNHFADKHGGRLIEQTDCMFLEEWLDSFCENGDHFNKWRHVLTLLWSYAVSRKMAESNEAEKVEKRSTSKKLEANRKKRLQLDPEGFAEIHALAPGFLQIAMEQSLVTLQSRKEICAMQHAHFRDGFLYVIRDKTAADTDMAFIKIAVTDQLEDIRQRSKVLHDPPIASPYLVHRRPERERREWFDGKPHWTFVNPAYISNAFAYARDLCPRFASMAPAQRPPFHEIRGLGARLYEDMGMPQKDIQSLMTHTSRRTTEIYLERGESALTDADFRPVAAPMKLMEVVKIKR